MTSFNFQLETLRSYIDGLLKKNKIDIPDDGLIEEAIKSLIHTPLFKDCDYNKLYDLISLEYSSFYDEEAKRMLGDNEHKDWINLDTGKAYHRNIEWKFWDDYEHHLKNNGFSRSIIDGINSHTNLILSSIEDPTVNYNFDRRGMVVGDVQSGKTANYTGLVCKAADAGYGVIIILAGMYNDLRSQTQERIDESFIGYDTSKTDFSIDKFGYRVGVGKRKPKRQGGAVIWHTTKEIDFHKKNSFTAGTPVDSTDPKILIIKKNKSVLENVNNWIKKDIFEHQTQILNASLLVIDDECDNASINTKKYDKDDDEYDITAINNGIRSLLKQFAKSSYVGYTATPYANILINRQTNHSTFGDDLFPRDFIINIPTPPNHIGPSKIFGLKGDKEIGITENDGYPLIEFVYDQDTLLPEIKILRTNTIIPESLSYSLRECLLMFVLTCAARLCRGQSEVHNSCLVHASQYVNIHIQLKNYIDTFREKLYNNLIYGSEDNKYWLKLEELWNKKFVEISAHMAKKDLGRVHNWEDIKKFIRKSVSRLTVKMINGNSKDSLDYKKYKDQEIYKNFIVIGGTRLSRGLTLEGLSVSYFLRSSTMYDTLMQMGRWFGYRDGYIDLCRLYTTWDIANAYRHIAFATEELRLDFDKMLEMGAQPKDWGLKIRSHEGVLMVTGYGKRRWGHKIRLNLGSRLLQSHRIYINEMNAKLNFNIIKKLINQYDFKINNNETAYISQGIDYNLIIDFIQSFHFAGSALWNPTIVKEYIKAKVQENYLLNWTVAILNSQDKSSYKEKLHLDKQPQKDIENLGKLNFTMRNGKIERSTVTIEKSYVSAGHEWIDFSKEQIQQIEKKYKKKITAKIARDERCPENGLLLLYPLYGGHRISVSTDSVTNVATNNTYGLDTSVPVFAPAISFPGKISESTNKEYIVDSQYTQQLELDVQNEGY